MILICGDPSQSVHPVPERSFQSDFWDSSPLCELRQEIFFPKDKNIPSDRASHIRVEKSNGAKSGEYDEWRAILREFCSQNSWDCLAVWDLALSASMMKRNRKDSRWNSRIDCRICLIYYLVFNSFPLRKILTTWNRGESMRLWPSFAGVNHVFVPFRDSSPSANQMISQSIDK
jgi:hypothetical protein